MTDSAGYAQACYRARPTAGPRLDMDDEQFADWARLLEHRAGVFIAPERRSFLVSGIRACMRENDYQDPREFYSFLISIGSDEEAWAVLVDRLTVHETCFFRHWPSMRLVSEKLVPDSLQRGTDIRLWSVGCATGEEAYSLAMLVDDRLADTGSSLGFQVSATDISLPALSRAREGVYLQRRLQDIPVAYQYRYCSKVSKSHFRVADDLRRRVDFSELNLRDLDEAPAGEVDLIYCQNLLIYYERQRRVQMVDRLAAFLRPGGMLVLGPGEVVDWKNRNMERVRFPDTLAYRRTD